tara:strand:+ start:95 stop:337 length:243 start_codon:yes stop_codon:yes gene_type:complete
MSTARIVCTILSTSRGIDIMSDKLSAKIMSADHPNKTYVIIVHEDGYAIRNVVEDKLFTLHSSEKSAVQTLKVLEEIKNK